MLVALGHLLVVQRFGHSVGPTVGSSQLILGILAELSCSWGPVMSELQIVYPGQLPFL
jgi:hypothetical protein